MKRTGIILLTPVVFLLLLIILLYVPPVQHFLCKKATTYASEATGMQINVRRIDLRFPLKLLVRGVEVVQVPDTILTLERFSASVQLLPLLGGKAELDDVTLQNAHINTANLIEGMHLSGTLGKFSLQSHGIDLFKETAIINDITLSDTHFHVILNDTTEAPKDTTETAMNWKASLLKLTLDNVSVNLQMPADTMQLSVNLDRLEVDNIEADLGAQHYGLDKLLLNVDAITYDSGTSVPEAGLDPSHLALRNIHVEVDSVYAHGEDMQAIIRQFSMEERSGLSIVSLEGSLFADSASVRVPSLHLKTPHSELNFTAQAYWDMMSLAEDRIVAHLNAYIGRQDVFLFGGELPEQFKKEYPVYPLSMQLSTRGNMNKLNLSRLSVALPGAFAVTGGGEVTHVLDSVHRAGSVELQMHTQNLDFLTTLIDDEGQGAIAIPENIVLALKAGMRGPQYHATMRARESTGTIHLDAGFNTVTEAYTADLKIDSLQINHFLPKDSIGMLSAEAVLKGTGTDVASPHTAATVQAVLKKLEYGPYSVANMHLDGALKNAMATAHLTSNNRLLVMDAQGSYALDKPYTQAKAVVDVSRIDLYELKIIPDTLKKPVALRLDANIGKDTVNVALTSGDLKFSLRSKSTLERLIDESTGFVDVLNAQIENKRLDHAELRRALPSAAITLTSGNDNPLNHYLALQHIKYDDMKVGFVATPRIGINGRAAIHALKVDTLQLDTIYFSIKQDTTLMAFKGGVINGPQNPQFVFTSSLTGEIRSQDAGLTLQYENDKGETGILLGMDMRPTHDGMQFQFTPEHPIIGFREFGFNGHNSVFVKDNFRVLADIEMLNSDGMGLLVHSLEEADSTYLQNIDIEVRRVELGEISNVLPYFPTISGLFSLETNYKKSAESLQVSAEGNIDELYYEGERVGDLGLGVTWLPDNKGTHYLNAYLTNEGEEVLMADGTYAEEKDQLSVNTTVDHFPLGIVNAFVPDGLVAFQGDIDGEVIIEGTSVKPDINGTLALDSVILTSRQYGFDFRFDNRPLQISNSRLVFDKFAIYTTSDNPFTIDGYVDMADLSSPMVDLSLLANKYQLLNAPRKSDSMLYGKVFIDMNSTVKGPADALVMRGNVKIQGNTDVTYVLIDSPLSVQDRLGELVEFTSFSDTIVVAEDDTQLVALGGLDMLMAIHIDQAAKVKVDLSPDRSSRVELEGGGELSFQYTPQGEMILTGRYTLSGGMVKYALPVIPLKEFKVNNGSYIEWRGNPMDPILNFKATERVRASVLNDDGNGSRMTNFDVSIAVKNKLADLELLFDLAAPEDPSTQDDINAMDEAERNKQAITLMTTGVYLAGGGSIGSNLGMGTVLNSVIQSQINNITGSALKNANISFGMENYDNDAGKRTDYTFSYAQRLFNDRVQMVIGGSISTGDNTEQKDTFIDNVSLEYRLDSSGTRYVRLFHNKDYQNVLEGEIIETGGGIVLRKKVNRLGELFIFKKKK